VSNLEKSVQWYCELLGQPYDLNSVTRPVYNLQINEHTGLTLDAGPEGATKKSSSEYPLFNFHTDNIEASYAYVKQLGYDIVSEIIQFDDFSFFTIRDLDGNVLMICTG
jgi:hypothetical protein